MNLDKLLSKIFKVKKSKLELTEKEKELLSQDKLISYETSVIHVDGYSIRETYNQYEELLFDLFREAKNFSLLDDHSVCTVNIKELTSYEIFSNLSKEEKKEFLHYLISKEKREKNKVKVPENYRAMLADHLLKTKLPFKKEELYTLIKHWSEDKFFYISSSNIFNQVHTEIELMIFLDFWGKKKLPYISEKSIINRINKCVKNNLASSDFYIFLKKLLYSKKIRYEEYRYSSYLSNAIERVLIDNYGKSINDSSPLFLLLPDHFGKKVNAEIIALENSYRTDFSKLLYNLGQSSKTLTPKNVYDNVHSFMTALGTEKIKVLISTIIKSATHCKSKVKSIPVTYLYYGKRFIVDHKPMPAESISIISGVLLLASYLKLNSCIPLIPIIIERSYARMGKNRGYGTGSRTLGVLGIRLLAQFFEKKGQTILVELYNTTKSKNIKKQIEKESKILKEQLGISLI
ncbi:hypothetical protein [Aquimarina litoralis]|uniref:hypothetical protein n=1 Tax=Aquimarina litoralis TaxID=584605 RepID=UPI001C59CF3E|nr:hypothetical protein [Aquimarina litoralis]MBW1297325.1 hypothetical protein [Aquimarina litoralis]